MSLKPGLRRWLKLTRDCRRSEAFAGVDQKHDDARRGRRLLVQIRIDEAGRNLRIPAAGCLEQGHASVTLQLDRFNDHFDRILLVAR